MTVRILPIAIMAATAAAMTGCNHKDLDYDVEPTTEVRVVYDWRYAPEAQPASMALYLFDTEGSRSPMMFSFTGRDGGRVHVPFTTYGALGFNNDITDWAVMADEFDIDRQGIFTRKASELAAYGLRTASIPRARGTEDEPVVSTPGMIWADRADNITVDRSRDTCIITLYPEECVCHYTVDVLNVKNIEYIHGALLDATLSGMADGYMTGACEPSGGKATMPFTLAPDAATASLHGEFLTFGINPRSEAAHIMSVYMYMTDGSRWHYTFDVSKQVDDAPDPTHVHIVVSNLDLPAPISGGGGLIPDVNDWNTVHIGIDMSI